MTDLFYGILYYLTSLFHSGNALTYTLLLFPFVILLELPFYLATTVYSVKSWLRMHTAHKHALTYAPFVTVVVTAYNETWDEIYLTLHSIAEQIYPGQLEILIIIDHAAENQETVKNAKKIAREFNAIPNHQYRVIEKSTRGGHASSMNLGLKLAKGEVLVMMDADTSIDNQAIANAAKHFINPNVIVVSGAIRVRNLRKSLITRFQALEYMISIQLGRFGLTEMNVLNNISGAYGVFRTKTLRTIGGWLNGSAEDLDLTLRIHSYMSLYKGLKMIHEPFSIAWTAAPTTLRALIRQRVRWDGDLFYIYVSRHWRFFSSNLISRGKRILMMLYALYFQLFLPFIIIAYIIVVFIQYNLYTVFGMFFIIYSYYLIISAYMFFLFLLLVSERVKHDIKFIYLILFNPVYLLFLRFASSIFILNEILFKSHKESSMAPWWVIRKTK